MAWMQRIPPADKKQHPVKPSRTERKQAPSSSKSKVKAKSKQKSKSRKPKLFLQTLHESMVSTSVLAMQQIKTSLLLHTPKKKRREILASIAPPYCSDALDALMSVAHLVENLPDLDLYTSTVQNLAERFEQCLVRHGIHQKQKKASDDGVSTVDAFWDMYVDTAKSMKLSEEDAEECTYHIMKLAEDRLDEVERRRVKERNKGSIRAFDPNSLPGGSDPSTAPTIRLLQEARQKQREQKIQAEVASQDAYGVLQTPALQEQALTRANYQLTSKDLRTCRLFLGEWSSFQNHMFRSKEQKWIDYLYTTGHESTASFQTILSKLRLADLTNPAVNTLWASADRSSIEHGSIEWPHLGITACSMDPDIHHRLQDLLQEIDPDGMDRKSIQEAHHAAHHLWCRVMRICGGSVHVMNQSLGLVRTFLEQELHLVVRSVLVHIQDWNTKLATESFLAQKFGIEHDWKHDILPNLEICSRIENEIQQGHVEPKLSRWFSVLKTTYSLSDLEQVFQEGKQEGGLEAKIEFETKTETPLVAPGRRSMVLPELVASTQPSVLASNPCLNDAALQKWVQQATQTHLGLASRNLIRVWGAKQERIRWLHQTLAMVLLSQDPGVEDQKQVHWWNESERQIEEALEKDGFGSRISERMHIFQESHSEYIQHKIACEKTILHVHKMNTLWLCRLREMAIAYVAVYGQSAQATLRGCHRAFLRHQTQLHQWIHQAGRPLTRFLPECQRMSEKVLLMIQQEEVAAVPSLEVEFSDSEVARTARLDPRIVISALMQQCGTTWLHKVERCVPRLRARQLSLPVWCNPETVSACIQSTWIKQKGPQSLAQACNTILHHVCSMVATDLLEEVWNASP